jgi:hypothetical protein
VSWTQKFSDAFTDTAFTALPTHNAAWAQDTGNGTWRISSNGTSAGTTTSGGARCYITGASAPAADQACQFKIMGSLRFREEGLLTRFTDGSPGNFWGGTGYLVYVETPDQLLMHRLDGGGSHTQIASSTRAIQDNDVLRSEAVGSGLTVIRNGTDTAISVTDATFTSGAVGVWCGTSIDDTTSMSVDDFVAEEWSGAAKRFLLVRQ